MGAPPEYVTIHNLEFFREVGRPDVAGEAAERLLGLTHLSLRANDLSARIAALEQAGVRILHATRTWNAEHASGAIFVVDPDGTRIEVVQSSGSRPSTD